MDASQDKIRTPEEAGKLPWPATPPPPNPSSQANNPLRSSAVARIAYLASDVVVSVQPSLATDSEFSAQLKKQVSRKDQSLVATGLDAVPAVSRLFATTLSTNLACTLPNDNASDLANAYDLESIETRRKI